MAEDKLCNIIYHMVTHDWHNALHKSGKMPPDLSLEDLVDYFDQTKLLVGVKQNSKTIVVDNSSDERKKPSSQCKRYANKDKNVKDKKCRGSPSNNIT
eukprot:7048245-Ditylum_brightwellii.AAC.1